MELIYFLPEGYDAVECNKCNRIVQDPETNGFWHCYGCNTDVHNVCRAPCSNKNCDAEIEYIQFLPDGYEDGAACNACDESIEDWEQGFWHCNECSNDYMRGCFN